MEILGVIIWIGVADQKIFCVPFRLRKNSGRIFWEVAADKFNPQPLNYAEVPKYFSGYYLLDRSIAETDTLGEIWEMDFKEKDLEKIL